MAKTIRLNVKMTSLKELHKKWGFYPPGYTAFDPIYIRCDAEGVISWEKNIPIFRASELIERDNVVIL